MIELYKAQKVQEVQNFKSLEICGFWTAEECVKEETKLRIIMIDIKIHVRKQAIVRKC